MINSGDTCWVLVSTALVCLMTPGLAFFYGGMVRRKNVLSTLTQCFIVLCVISLQWILFGYSLAFSPHSAFIGGLQWMGLKGVGLAPYPDYAATIPHQLFMAFQMMFAVITPALIIGAFAERIKFSGYLVFVILWATFVYDPVAHWVWGMGGWLHNRGVLDFAGGTVVHINSGIAALVTALFIWKRNQHGPPHNLPLTVIGAALFGFNAGSALAANGLAVTAFITTNTAAAAAGLMWMLLEWGVNGMPTILGLVTGAVAGLVAITPAAGFVSPISAIYIGLGVSVVCFIFVSRVKPALGYDDSLDAFGVHGIGGIFGALCTGLLAQKVINAAGDNGAFFGNPKLFMTQLLAVSATVVYTGVATFILFKLTDMVFGIRVTLKDEQIGLDLSQHHESGYTILE